MTFQSFDIGGQDLAGRLGQALGTGLKTGFQDRMKREQRLLRKDISDLYHKRINFINADLKDAITKDEIENLKSQKKALLKELAGNQKRLRTGEIPVFDTLEQFGEATDFFPNEEPSKKQAKTFFNPNNKSHQDTVVKVLNKHRGNREKAQKELNKIFIRK